MNACEQQTFNSPDQDLDPPFNFDLERMKKAVEGPTISFPRGLTGAQRREFLRNRLAEIDAADSDNIE